MEVEKHATACHSPVILRYRNRDIRQEDIRFIRATIVQRADFSRERIAQAICEAWNWRQFNGQFSFQACYDLLLRLEEWGHIKLPKVRRRARAERRWFPLLPSELIPLAWSEVNDSDADLSSLVVRPIAPEERLGFRLFVDRFHYLGCRPIVGENLLYIAVLPDLADEVVAFLAWASAAFRAPLREHYIGWDEKTKLKRQHLIVNNIRFLVPPWVRVRNLASRVLSLNLRRLSSDWQERWGHPVYMAETFVDTSRFKGTCYRASNWTYLGHTAGRSKRGNQYLSHGTPKAYYVYPLHRRARDLLCHALPKGDIDVDEPQSGCHK